MTVGRLTKKCQTTVPARVRKFLCLGAGDQVAWEIEDGKVTLKKATPLDLEFAKGIEESLGEWNGRHDEEAYRDL